MRVIFIGDIHGNFHMLHRFRSLFRQPDLVIQCGDFGYQHGETMTATPYPVHFCDGNHENFHDLFLNRAGDPTPRAHEIIPNLFWQDRGSTLTLPDGRVVLFAGGAFSVDWPLRTEGLDLFSREELLSDEDFSRFPDCKVDIVVSHTMPSRLLPEFLGSMLQFETRDPSCDVLDKVFDRYRPKLWFFGHWHERRIVEMDGCTFHALGAFDSGSSLDEGQYLLEG